MMVELPICKSLYKITCETSEKEKLLYLAAKLNKRVNELSLSLKNADEKTLLVIAALTLEEELEHNDISEQEDEEKLNEQDMYDAVSENMENIADTIEKLIVKIQNY